MDCQDSAERVAIRTHLEDLLDQALADSFPASDPIGIAWVD